MKNNIKPGIITFPASNCDRDMERALREVFSLDPVLIWHDQELLPDGVTHIILPGGFSFGDYLRAGALAAHSPIMSAVKRFAHHGGRILGVCNGFQVLCEAQLLPGVLLKNHHDRFVCSVETVSWLGAHHVAQNPQKIKLPIAHKEGRYFASDVIVQELFDQKRVVITYEQQDEHGNASVNGSIKSIAGIVGGPARNIIGMMPHPERMLHKDLLGTDGAVILQEFLFG